MEAIQALREETASGPGRGRRPEPDDTTLVRRAQGGDVSAFEGLYRQHAGRVHGLCLRLTGKAQEAEEMTQEVFVRAWEHLESFKGPTHFRAWLHTVASNLARNEWRTRLRRGTPIEFDEQQSGSAGSTLTDGIGLSADLERAIAGLPPGARSVFLLHDVHGYRHGEIARMQGLAVGTTKAQLHRARKLLRKVLSL